jgi:2-desacetyl-2-hydroxyethyl bacteriochlorophyllide A dehydrogenase
LRAMELPGVGAPLRLVNRPDPEPGPGQARVRVQACGVCGSDLLVQKGAFGPEYLPLIPGHEAAGVVDAVGEAVDESFIGKQVAIWYVDAPADSPYTRRGRPNIAPEGRRMGMHVDGAMAEYVVRPVETLITPPAPVDPKALAVLTDAAATPYHAYVRIAHLEKEDTVVVLGIGGVGSNAVQLANYFGARVVAASRSEEKLELARSLGAEEVIRADDDLVDRVKAACPPFGPDVVIQCAPSGELDQQAVAMAAPGGRVVFVGTSSQVVHINALDMVFRELSLLGTRGFTADDIRAVINLYVEGKILVDHLTGHTRPLEEANEALRDRLEGRGLRTVLLP